MTNEQRWIDLREYFLNEIHRINEDCGGAMGEEWYLEMIEIVQYIQSKR